MSTVTLNDVLAARDMRVQRQSEMIKKYQTTLVCLTMNIAGPVKVSPEIAYAYQVGVTRILEGLTTVGFALAAKEELSSPAGHCLLLAVDAPADEVKRLCVSLENLDDLGRLFDMDVIASDGRKLTRSEERCCLICGLPGRGCASRRIHPVEELQRKTSQIIQDYRTQAESRQIASLAVQSMQDEVCATPKPGLVDCLDNGSHRDMDIFTFNASSAALYPYFQACYLAGAQDRQLPAREAFDHLQTLGIEAERVMRRATAGVNTHKGAIYTLGVLCGAAGRE